MNTESVSKTALRDKAVDTIKSLLLSGDYTPGSPIREVDIAKQLNISRIPIREAFRILEREGLLEYIPNCGVRVKEFTKKDVLEIYRVRMMLDIFTIDEVFENITPAVLSELEMLLKRMANRQDFPLCNDLFHNKLIMLSSNSRLHQIWNNMEDQVRLIMLACASTDDLHKISLDLHQDIINALASGDKDAYYRSVVNHTNVALNYLSRDLED